MRRGLTLVELLVVVALIGLVVAVVAPALLTRRADDGEELARSHSQILAVARDLAVREARVVEAVFDGGGYEIAAIDPATGARSLIERISITAMNGPTNSRVRFVFRADGSARADTLWLSRGASLRLLTVDPWTGGLIVTRP